MSSLHFVFINSVTSATITKLEDILLNERLVKYLWIELILNPHLAKIAALHVDNAIVRKSLSDALSWYVGFRWIFQKNGSLEKLRDEKILVPYKIESKIFRLHKRNFLKGITHAGLC